MGGRLDATNVADPLASAIVSIDYDHQAYLGKSLGAIATEKAGVLRAGPGHRARPAWPAEARARDRRGRRAPVGAPPRGRRRRRCASREEAGSARRPTPRRLYRGLAPSPAPTSARTSSSRCASSRKRSAAGLPVDLARARPRHRGHALAGAPAVGARATRRCSWTGPTTPPARVRWPRTCAAAAPSCCSSARWRDKDVRGLARALFPLAAEVVLTRARVDRAASPRRIAGAPPAPRPRALREVRPRKALALARRAALAARGTPVVVAGSLYLVGEVHGAPRPGPLISGLRGRREPLPEVLEDSGVSQSAGPTSAGARCPAASSSNVSG